MLPSSGLWGGLGLWFPVYHPIVRRAPALTLCERVFLFTSPYTCILCRMFSLDPSVDALASLCTCWWKDRIIRSCASHTCVAWSVKRVSFFPLVHQAFLSLVKSLSTTDPLLPTTKLICSNFHFEAAALSAPIMLLCCSFASAFSTSRNPTSLFVDRLNPNIYTIYRASLIATQSGRLPRKRFTKNAAGSKMYRVSWLFLTGIVTFISSAFTASSSLLQILWNSSRRHSVLMLLSLSSVTNLSMLFGFCAACMLSYRCLGWSGVQP